ncbi:hypothetical protein Plhal710r2_c045g0147691 [Plasmopara halstedii]
MAIELSFIVRHSRLKFSSPRVLCLWQKHFTLVDLILDKKIVYQFTKLTLGISAPLRLEELTLSTTSVALLIVPFRSLLVCHVHRGS